jgi:hypothetical protein
MSVLLPAGIVGGIALAVFGGPVIDSLRRAVSNHFLSGYALNFCWIVTHWIRAIKPAAFGGLNSGQADLIITSNLRYTLLPKLLFVAFYVWAWVASVRQPKSFGRLLRFSLVGYLAYFTFNTGVHENHLFLAVIVAVALYAEEGARHLSTAVAVALLANINLILFYGFDGTGYHFSRVLFGADLALVLSIVAVVFFLAVFVDALARSGAGSEPLPGREAFATE